MQTQDIVLVRGMRDTREALARWSANPWPVLSSWLLGAYGIALLLLCAVWAVSSLVEPDVGFAYLPGSAHGIEFERVAETMGRNSLVLALHAFACVAGFIALNSLPYSAARRSGISKTIHEKAGPYAMLFVAGATFFSLATQAYFLGATLSSAAAQFDLTDFQFLVLLLPHAVPELTALFLPLAAWLIASRRGDWDQLLAATLVTVAVAVPTLLLSVSVEVFLFPHLIEAAVK
jgi:hypothetical protein